MELRRFTVCRDCLAATRRTSTLCRLRTGTNGLQSWTALFNAPSSTGPRSILNPQRREHQQLRKYAKPAHPVPPAQHATAQQSDDLRAVNARVQELTASVLRPQDSKIPSEQRLLYVLEQFEALGKTLADDRSIASAKNIVRKRQETATSALLGSVNHRQQPSSVTKASLLSLISQKAEEILRHPNVFVTPAVLKSYVGLQDLLHQPSSFPDVFELYANKPIPRQSGVGEVSYSPSNPTKMNAAIDEKTADAALQSAIVSHNLPLAIDIINSTYCTLAYKKAKVLRQALVPIGGVVIAPIAAYTLANQFSNWQSTMTPQHAQMLAFAGILTYFGAVGTTGYVAVTTANDQMDRVTWAPGVPLWERWVREDERAAIDKVAGAWGFQSIEKRGEEEGQEWDDLREFVGIRGMILDRISLMEGMQ